MNINKITELWILSIDVQEFIKAILKDVVNGEIRLYCNKMKGPFIELHISQFSKKIHCKFPHSINCLTTIPVNRIHQSTDNKLPKSS